MIQLLKNWAIYSSGIALALFSLYALIGGFIWFIDYVTSINMGPFGVLTVITIIASIVAGFFMVLDE